MNEYIGESLTDLVVTKRHPEHRKDSHTGEDPFMNGTHQHHHDHIGMNGHSPQQIYSNGDLITVIRDTVMDTRGRIIATFDRIDAGLLDKMTIEGFSDAVARERLSSMPHRGSLWDRVLRWAEFYALQIATYAETIGPFVPESRSAAKQIFTLLRSLLDLGEENASALNSTFGVFYQIGLSLSFLSSHEAKLGLNGHVREDAGRAFQDIHSLVFDVASHYQRSVRDLSTGSVSLDFISLFRGRLDSFYRRRTSIIDHLWRHALGGNASRDVQKVRKWLNQRSYMKTTSTQQTMYRSQYDEYTCEWFQRHLLEFTRSTDSVLAITAPAGSGKTILSSWIQERLQRPMDRKTHTTIMFSFEADIPAQCTSLALAKSLALQLLDVRVGNSAMIEAIFDAYTQHNPATIEAYLWSAINAAFSSSSEPTMIIIDGLDQLQGDNIEAIYGHITKLEKHSSLKTIILSKPEASLKANKNWKTFAIKPDYVYEDLRHIAKHALRRCEQFVIQKETDQHAVIDHLVKAAEGSFLWLLLAVRILRRTKSIEDFQKHVREAQKTLEGMINKQAESINFADADTMLMLSIMLLAQRPLTIHEFRDVLQVDLQRKTNTHRHVDIVEKVSKMNGLVQVNESEVVRFRHSAIRSFFMNLQAKGEKIPKLRDAQTDLIMRLLTYTKACLTKKHDVCLETLPHSDVEHLYADHLLLEYVVRNWTHHFQQSPLFKPAGGLELSPELKALFPTSPVMGLLEWSCWDDQVSGQELVRMHDLSLRIRSEVFDQKHESTLQSLIVCGFIHQEYSTAPVAAQYFFRASLVGQAILPRFSKITISCTTMFLAITESIKFTTRTEVVKYREEMLRFIIMAYKHDHGETSDIVIRHYKALAELYVSIQEEENAAACWKELRIIIVNKHGEGSDAEREISGKLMIVLKGKQDFEIEQYREDIFAIDEKSTIVWDSARIAIFLQMALACEHREEHNEAEEIYVTLWTRLLRLCRNQHHDIDLRISVLKIAVEYSRFLYRRQRHEEAKNILIVIWTEHQHFGCESIDFYLQLKAIGELMRSLDLLAISVSVFEKVVQWFKAVGKHDHEAVRACEDSIVEIVEEITTKKTTQREESTEMIETIIRRMFSSATVVTKEYIKITRTAVQLYVKREQWSDAISVLTKALALMWTERSSWGGEVCLPDEFTDESVEFAIQLGRCYMKCKHYQESLACYLQLWQAVRSSSGFHDTRRKIIVEALGAFYLEHKRWKLLIELHRELLVDYRRHLGRAHDVTISTLYVLAGLVLEHGHGHAVEHYREIVDVIGTTNLEVSLKAYKALCQLYYDESNWVELKVVCQVVWNLLVQHPKEYDFNADFVEMLYIRYIYVLSHHHTCDHKTRVAIALQYKEVCVLLFGSISAIAMRARLEYASVLMESDTTKNEAIGAYEEIITISKTNKTVVDESSLTTVQKRLTDAYVYAHVHGSASPAVIQQAIAVLHQRYEQLKISLGCAHKETLNIFKELISMHFKLKSADYEKTIVHMLRENVIEIISKEQRSQVLFEAATTLGAIYIACGLHQYGLDLMYQIRRQIIADHTHGSKDSLKIDKSVGRISFVFLVAFELTLKGSISHSYSEIMANWLTESVLYENYRRCSNPEAKIEILLMRGAHLRAFWALHERREEIVRLEQQVFDIFFKRYGTVVKTRGEMVKVFLSALLIHLGSRETYNVEIARVASVAGNQKVEELLKVGRFQEAHEVGYCVFQFVMANGGYHKARLIGFGFKLAGYMAGSGLNGIPAELRTRMLITSREIMSEVLHACKDLNINFLQLHDHELNELVGLLGEQENYKELENILQSLWKSRHGQKHWSEDTLINLGVRLIESRHLAAKDGHSHGAIHLAEDISYNLRRVLGGLHPHALAISTLLSQLYTSAKQYGDAINVHEDIIQLIVSGDDGDDRTVDTVDARVARHHLDLLKAAYQRNEGWVKSAGTYKSLVGSLLSMRKYKNDIAFKDVQPVQKWTPKLDESMAHLDLFAKPESWVFIVDIVEADDGRHAHVNGTGNDVVNGNGNGTVNGMKMLPAPIKQKESGWSLRRVSENWGMAFGHGREERPMSRPNIIY